MVVTMMIVIVLSTILFGACATKKTLEHGISQDTMKGTMTKTFATELEKYRWLNTLENQSMSIGIRCTFTGISRQCYLGESNDHPISVEDTRLGIPLSSQQTSDGWIQVEGVWKPEPDALSIDQVDLRVDKVLNTPPKLLLVMLQ